MEEYSTDTSLASSVTIEDNIKVHLEKFVTDAHDVRKLIKFIEEDLSKLQQNMNCTQWLIQKLESHEEQAMQSNNE